MHFSILGPLEVHDRDVRLSIRRGRPRSLLHLLLINPRLVLSTEVIADRLYPDEPPQDASNAVHQMLSYLRRAFGESGRDLLSTAPSGYRLDAPDDAVDLWLFDRLVSEALDVGPAPDSDELLRACSAADEAIKLWRGDPLPESAHLEWSTGVRTRLQDGYVQAQLSRLDAYLKLGRHREVVLDAQALAAAYPLREDFHHQHAMALYRSGRQGEALETLRAVRSLLARELGVDPGRRLQELEQHILQQSAELEWAPPRDSIVVPPASSTPPAAGEMSEPPTRRWDLAAPPPVPTPGTSLIGREDEVDTLRSLAQPGALVTVTGPAGVGKTRLLLALAAKASTPTWYLDLAGASVDDDVALLVTQLLIPSYTGGNPLVVLAMALQDTEALLILDGCEHVIESVGALLHTLHRPDTRATIVLGSRRPSGAPDERTHRVAPLPVPDHRPLAYEEALEVDAVRLFLDRARLAKAAYVPTYADAEVIAHIVTAVDGLPLAIELAASLLDVETPSAILKRLEGQLDAIPHARFSLPSRERTLATAIDASVSVLADDERDLLAALGVFADRFDLAAAAAVTGADTRDAYAGLVALARQSLVVSLGDDSFQLLAPVRAWSRAAIDADHAAVVRARHAHHVCDTVWAAWRRGVGLPHRKDLRGLAQILPDARSALAWSLERRDSACAIRIAVACSWVWTLQGAGEDGLRELQRVKELSETNPLEGHEAVELRAALLRSIGLVANPVGRLSLAADVCAEAAALYLQIGDHEQAAASLLTLGIAHWAQGAFIEARKTLQEARELTASDTTSWNHLAAHVLLARTLLDQGAPDADTHLDKALQLAQSAGDPQLHGLALACRARWFMLKQDAATSELAAHEALRIWRTINYVEGEMMALNLLARTSLFNDEPDAGWQHARTALGMAQPSNHRGGMCEALESLGLVAAASGRRERALLLLEVADRERMRVGVPIPAADRATIEVPRANLREALGAAATLVSARASLTSFDDLVSQLLSTADV